MNKIVLYPLLFLLVAFVCSAATIVKDNNTIEDNILHMSFYTPHFVNMTQTTARLDLVNGRITKNYETECKADFDDGTSGCLVCNSGECGATEHGFTAPYSYYYKRVGSDAKLEFINNGDAAECSFWQSKSDTVQSNTGSITFLYDSGTYSHLLRYHTGATTNFATYDGGSYTDSGIANQDGAGYEIKNTWNYVELKNNGTYFIFGNSWNYYYTEDSGTSISGLDSFSMWETRGETITIDNVFCYDPNTYNESANILVTTPLHFDDSFDQISFNATFGGGYSVNFSCDNGTSWYSQSEEFDNYTCGGTTNYLTLKLVLESANTSYISYMDVETSLSEAAAAFNVTLIYPLNDTNITDFRNITFNYSVNQIDVCAIKINGTINRTQNASVGYNNITIGVFDNGLYNWSVNCTQGQSQTNVFRMMYEEVILLVSLSECPFLGSVGSYLFTIFAILLSFAVMAWGKVVRHGLIGVCGSTILMVISFFLWSCLLMIGFVMTMVSFLFMWYFIKKSWDGAL